MRNHPVINAIIALVFLAGLTFGINYDDYSQRSERRHDLCLHDLRQWQTIHDLLAENASQQRDPHSLDRYFKVLGQAPKC
jgi:hypothetical protein